MIPDTYQAWRHCIEVDCGLTLTPQFIAERIAALENVGDMRTRQFLSCYGDGHRQRVLSWFREAAATASG